MSSIDWDDLAKSQKLVKTKDERSCGNLMAEYKVTHNNRRRHKIP